MHSTPNYGYETQASAISVIDGDIRRVEGKADVNATAIAAHAERITRNEEHMACLAKQKCDMYSKCEADRLLDGKVDKQEGHGLIPEKCLRQICTNKEDISLLGQYIKELQEQNACLKEALANKAGKESGNTWRNLELLNGFSGAGGPVYTKLESNIVIVMGTCLRGATPAASEAFALLPAGFRPATSTLVYLVASQGKDGNGWSTYGWVHTDGYIRFAAATPPANYDGGIAFHVSFPAPH